LRLFDSEMLYTISHQGEFAYGFVDPNRLHMPRCVATSDEHGLVYELSSSRTRCEKPPCVWRGAINDCTVSNLDEQGCIRGNQCSQQGAGESRDRLVLILGERSYVRSQIGQDVTTKTVGQVLSTTYPIERKAREFQKCTTGSTSALI